MITPPELQYYIGRMGPDHERTKLNLILKDLKAKIGSLENNQGQGGVTPSAVTSVNGQTGDVTITPGLSVVATDPTIDGNGTPGDPLSVAISELISSDGGNDLTLGVDGGLYVTAGSVVLDGGYTGNIGFSGGPDLQVGDSLSDRSLSDVLLMGWEVDCFPSGSVSIQFDVNGVSISAGGNPFVTASTNNSGLTTSWADNEVNVGDLFSFEIVSVSGGVQFVRVTLYGVKN